MDKAIEYQLQDINTRDIVVDDLGQRDVNRRRAQFNKIMREFDPNLIQPISVAQIDGKYYCFDGQMTMKVLKAKNANRDLCVKCRVYRGMTKMDAANMFINQRGTVSKVNLADKIRVKANYGDERAIAFQQVTERNGMEISWTGNVSRNSIMAVSTLWDEFKMFNDDELFGSFIRVIKGAWDGDPAGSQANILKGVGLFMRSYKEQAKEEILIQKLHNILPGEIVRNASVDRTTGARKYAVQILLAYNKGLREDKKLPNIL